MATCGELPGPYVAAARGGYHVGLSFFLFEEASR